MGWIANHGDFEKIERGNDAIAAALGCGLGPETNAQPGNQAALNEAAHGSRAGALFDEQMTFDGQPFIRFFYFVPKPDKVIRVMAEKHRHIGNGDVDR